MHLKLINLDLTPDIQSFKKVDTASANWSFKFTASSAMANPQLDHDPDDGEEPECLRQTQSRRAQPLSRRYLSSEIDEVETNDLRVATPVADSDTYQKVQHRPRRAYTKADMGIYMLPEQAVDSYNSPSITPRRLAKDTSRNDTLPNPAPRGESNMMRQPETLSITQEQLVAEVKGIYAGLVMVETKCIEVDNAQSTEGRLTPEKWQHLVALHRTLMLENGAASNLSSPKTPHDHELGALLSEVSLRSQSFCRLSSRLHPLLQSTKGSPSCPSSNSVLMPEPSTTSFDQHLAMDSFLFYDEDVTTDPIYSVQAAPQDPDFLFLDALQRTSVGIAETSAKEDLTGALPAAITPDPILQTYGEADRQEPFNPMVNVASAGQGIQNTGYVTKNLRGVTSSTKLKCKQWPEEHLLLCMSEMSADIRNVIYSRPTSDRSAQGGSTQP
ncbi:Telomerase-binding EST1A [Fusarium subglutinans]|uniref:Telomerase-binding EST1A n=1 Tax=Gibberella subglutinans TaxID=42677 RepID=A0A8H5PGS0_GIBSU|nr:Telomerase-binding EST1A [Fusarium subglutinans]KAF5596048.1 Telomerase-binding EST1A [Fusarium subglutinans]